MAAVEISREVLGAVAETPSDVLEACAAFTIGKFLGQGKAKAAAPVDHFRALDAVAMLFSTSIRQQWSDAQFAEWLSGSAINSEKAALLARALADGLASSKGSTRDQLLRDSAFSNGFLPRLTGAQWTSGHALGDRTVRPPGRSRPAFEFAFKTEEEGGASSDFVLSCTAEQAQDLLSILKDAEKEAERVARGQ